MSVLDLNSGKNLIWKFNLAYLSWSSSLRSIRFTFEIINVLLTYPYATPLPAAAPPLFLLYKNQSIFIRVALSLISTYIEIVPHYFYYYKFLLLSSPYARSVVALITLGPEEKTLLARFPFSFQFPRLFRWQLGEWDLKDEATIETERSRRCPR